MEGSFYLDGLIRPNDLSVLKHEEYPWRTLLTCKTYNEYTNEYMIRVLVCAVLVDIVPETK